MGQKVGPNLSVHFGLDASDAEADAQRLGGVVEQVAASSVQHLNAIDQAAKGINPGAASGKVVALGTDAQRASVATQLAFRQVEASTASLTARLERQVETFGKSRAELRAMRVEAAAQAADDAGLTAEAAEIRRLDDRLRVLAAARQAEALAADQQAAAHRRLAAEVRASNAADQANATSLERLRQSIDPTRAAIQRINMELEESTRLYRLGSFGADEYARQQAVLGARLAAAETGINGIGASARRGSGALTQLSFQLNDVATMAMAGASPFQIFATQAGQIFQVAQMADGGVAGFGRQLAGLALRFAPAITAAGVATVAFNAFTSGLDKSAGIDAFVGKLGLTKDELEKLGDQGVTFGDVMQGVWDMIAENSEVDEALRSVGDWFGGLQERMVAEMRRGAVEIYGLTAGLVTGTLSTWDRWPAALGDIFLRGVNAAVGAIEWLANAAIDAINRVTGSDIARVSFERAANRFAGAGKQVGDAYATAVVEEMARADRALSLIGQNIVGATKDRIAGRASDISADRRAAEAKKALADAERARQKAAQEEKRAAEDARRELERQAQVYRELARLYDPATAKALEFSDALDKIWKAQRDGIISPETARQWEMLASGIDNQALVKFDVDLDGLDEAAGRWREIDESLAAQSDRFLDAAQDFADIVGGGLGETIRSMLPLLDQAHQVFGSGSPFAKIAMGAGIGAAASGAAGGSSAGGAIGGALGGKLGQKLLSTGLESLLPGLGAFAGPIGSIAGGLLGGVVGGLLKKTKSASATVEIMAGEAMTASIAGNSAKLKAVAGGLADSLIAGLSGIADQLGGELGNDIRFSIGQRKKKFVLDPTGMGRTKGAGTLSFDTEAEAIAAAVQGIIQKGAIVGLQAGTDALIRGGGDLETQLQKALSFEGVFKELRQRTDPVGYALEEIAQEFGKLEKIFVEAGASAGDFARLQELRTLKEAEARAQAEDAVEDIRQRLDLERQLLEAQGDTAALRRLDLEALEPANRALQERIWSIQDEQAAIEETLRAAAEIAAERAGIQRQIYEAQGRTDLIRQMDLEALDPANRDLQRQLYALIDAQAAAAEAEQVRQEQAAEAQRAAEEAARAAEQLRDAWRSIADTIMDEVRRIRGEAGGGSLSFAALQGRFNTATAAARAGDQDAARSLTDLSRQLLDQAARVATSRQELDRIQAVTASSLEQTARLIGGGTVTAAGLPPMTAAAAVQVPAWWVGTSVAGGEDRAELISEIRALREEVASLRKDNNDGNAQAGQKLGKIATTLDAVTAQSGGNAVATMAAAA